MPKYTKAEIAEALATCKRWMPKGSTVFTILRRVGRSGMARDISVVVMKRDGRRLIDLHPNYNVAIVTGRRLVSSNGHDAIRMLGCGMDMGFDLIHSLSYALHGSGDALTQRWL